MEEIIDWGPEETREEYVRRLAQNRYDMRVANGIKGNAKSDWDFAEGIVAREEKRDFLKEKEVINKLKTGGY